MSTVYWSEGQDHHRYNKAHATAKHGETKNCLHLVIFICTGSTITVHRLLKGPNTAVTMVNMVYSSEYSPTSEFWVKLHSQ